MTALGPEKITFINKNTQKVKIKIEGEEQEFSYDFINPFVQIYFCIITEKKIYWTLLKVLLGENLYSVKNKIGKMFKVHPSRILIIHRGKKLKTIILIYLI